RFCFILFFALLSFPLIVIFVDMVGNLSKFLDKDVPLFIICKYYIFYIPHLIILVLPIAMLLASLFSLSQMANHNELTAIKSAGIGLHRILIPLFIFGLLISALALAFGEKIVPPANQEKTKIEDEYIETVKRTQTRITNIFWRDSINRRVFIGDFNTVTKTARKVSIQKLDGNKIIERLDARTMKWEDGTWVLRHGYRRIFSDEKEEALAFEEIKDDLAGLGSDAARFDAKRTRTRAVRAETFSTAAMRKTVVRPMDVRWCYYTSHRPVWNEPRPDYASQCWPGNRAFVTRRKRVTTPEGPPFNFVSEIGAQHALSTDAYYVPIRVKSSAGPANQGSLLDQGDEEPNISTKADQYLISIGWPTDKFEDIWSHAISIGYSPAYLRENSDGLKLNWPRIPLPNTKEILELSTVLGGELIGLLDTEVSVPGVTHGEIGPEMRMIAIVSIVHNQGLTATSLRVEARWGHFGVRNAVMPGNGKFIEREWSPEERDSIVEGVTAQGMDPGTAFGQLGETCLDIYLNDDVYWSGIPKSVWDYRIGGYQVIKKWLSYREHSVLGRSLSEDEARYVRDMARRLTAIVLLQPALDKNYLRVKDNAYEW
ncbi:MAG: LptF/LptG family permease, partial [Chloroflexi bacterium]|nr:LptF/LptG family permease [Chloroflexota bacterium]